MKEFVMPWQDHIKIFYQEYKIEQANSIVRFQLDKDGRTRIEERYVSFFARKVVQRIRYFLYIFTTHLCLLEALQFELKFHSGLKINFTANFLPLQKWINLPQNFKTTIPFD
jgi:hypothetical protein